jgi:hypothetical protein
VHRNLPLHALLQRLRFTRTVLVKAMLLIHINYSKSILHRAGQFNNFFLKQIDTIFLLSKTWETSHSLKARAPTWNKRANFKHQ